MRLNSINNREVSQVSRSQRKLWHRLPRVQNLAACSHSLQVLGAQTRRPVYQLPQLLPPKANQEQYRLLTKICHPLQKIIINKNGQHIFRRSLSFVLSILTISVRSQELKTTSASMRMKNQARHRSLASRSPKNSTYKGKTVDGPCLSAPLMLLTIKRWPCKRKLANL